MRPEAVARTRKVCDPTPRPDSEVGDVHAVNAAESREQEKVEDGWFDEKLNDALVDVVVLPAAGPAVIVVSGAFFHAAAAGVAPAKIASRAKRTSRE